MDFTSIILGTDINAYGVARSLHEAYGVRSHAFGVKPLRFTRASKIVDVEVHEDFDTDEGFLRTMKEVAERFQDQKPLLLTSCSDGYTALIAKHKKVLEEDFVFNYIDYDLQQKLENPFQEDFSFHKSIGVIDVINSAVSKQTGIEFIEDFYGFDQEIIAIGDDFNDIEFLSNTSLSYSLDYVTNKEVRKVCNFSVRSVAELISNLM